MRESASGKRLFLACTPRTGNLWFRKIIAGALGIRDIAAHTPEEIGWDALPEAFLVAMHWPRTTALQRLLDERRIAIISTMRHPLDVLISILHFCQIEPGTARWLAGEAGNESSLMGAVPTDPRFQEYAVSERAAALLSVSWQWRHHAKAMVRYEDMIEHPRETVGNVLGALGETPIVALDALIQDYQIDRLRTVTGNHCWLGRPGLWRTVLTDRCREAICSRHREIFDAFGYSIDAPSVSEDEASENWRECSLGRS